MPTFEYKATLANGDPTTGFIEANDEAAASALLRGRGLVVESVVLVTEEIVELRESEADVLVDHLAAATDAGLPLVATLQTLAEDAEQPRLSHAARQLSDMLQRGVPLAEALGSFERSLPRHVQATVRAGVQSGQLAEAFHRFAEQRLRARALKRMAWQSVAYPAAVLVLFAGLVMLFCFTTVPKFVQMFEEFDFDLPKLTELLVNATAMLPQILLGSIVVVAIAVVLTVLFGRATVHRLLETLPVLGGLWTAYSQWELASTLGNFAALRLPMPDALALTSQAIGNRYLARACTKVREQTNSGVSLSQALAESKAFDSALPAAAAWARDPQSLARALQLSGDVFAERLQSRAVFWRRLLPPIVLIVVGACTLIGVVALFAPLVGIMQSLSG